MVALTPSQMAAVATIREAFADADVVLIGALALRQHLPFEHRTTDDLDLAVSVPLEGFVGPIISLEGWRRDSTMEHRFLSPAGQMVDVLPTGPELIEQGHIEWPSGERMSLVGFDLAFVHHTEETVGETTMLVPTAAVIAFLKMRAWLDRPAIRTKDLGDLAHLLVGYVGDDDDRRFDDDIFALNLDFEDVSPFCLGLELGRIMTPLHQPHALEFLEKVSPERLAAHGPACWTSADDAERALVHFRNGLEHHEVA
jgi:predicted nucleotidyltransferase